DGRIYQYTVNDDMLGIIYKHAIAFVFPSLYEGFGLPVIEAFSCNCPVILSNSSCFPEIAGDGAIYFDGNDIEAIQNIIEKVLYNKALREELIYKGRERAKVFTWEITARKTFSLYKNIVTSV
ncbi:MAG: glycosyltransferase, partial [Candidatus Eremiobacterota bacterium]